MKFQNFVKNNSQTLLKLTLKPLIISILRKEFSLHEIWDKIKTNCVIFSTNFMKYFRKRIKNLRIEFVIELITILELDKFQ